MMRWFTALSTLNFIETLVALIFLAGWLATVVMGIMAGLPIWVSVIGAAIVWFGIHGLIGHHLGYSAKLRDIIFRRFGFPGPAPSRPDQVSPRLKCFFIGLASALVVTVAMALPLALILGPTLGRSLFEATWTVLLLELAIGAPITLIGFNIAEDNARVEFGIDKSPPKSDDDDLAHRIRGKWKNEIEDDLKR